MDIIALAGPSRCGKTGTLIIVYDMLPLQGGVSSHRRQLGADPRDFSDIVIWNGKHKRIAFFTMGDYSGEVVNAVTDTVAQKCDLLICACNNHFVRPFTVFTLHNTNIITKHPAANPGLQQSENLVVAQQIFNLI